MTRFLEEKIYPGHAWGEALPACCCRRQVTSVVYNSVRPHRRQPTRLPRPWDSPGKNTGVSCHFLLQCMKVKSEKWKWSHSVVSNSPRPHWLQPTRLLCPWDFPGKSTGVGCHRLLQLSAWGDLKLKLSIASAAEITYQSRWMISVPDASKNSTHWSWKSLMRKRS